MTKKPVSLTGVRRQRARQEREQREEQARRAADASEFSWGWRSDTPITGQRWRIAREARGYDVDDLACYLDVNPDVVRAIEDGRQQPTTEQLWDMMRATHFPEPWFHRPPFQEFGATSLDWHDACEWNVCDVCEREYPDGHIPLAEERFYEAVYRCATCGLDLCDAHAHADYDPVTIAPAPTRHDYLCKRCWRARYRPPKPRKGR